MKLIRLLFIIVGIALLIILTLPENVPLKFQYGGYKVNTIINPPIINWQIGNVAIRKDLRTRLGLDLKGGSHLVFEADTKNVNKQDLQDSLNSARDIIERRVNLFGVSEPVVQTLKSGDIYRISVDLPGIDDVSQAVSLIGQTAQLTFKEENPDIDPKIATQTPVINRLTKDTGLNGPKKEETDQMTFEDDKGKVVDIVRGPVWISILPTGNKVDYQ